MADIVNPNSISSSVGIVGSPPNGDGETYRASVILEDGIYKLATTKKVNVESLSGVQEAASNYFFFEAVALSDTLRIQIAATASTPALDKTFTVLTGENRFTFTSRVALALNSDFVNFQPYFKAYQVKDNSIIFIENKTIAEAGENKTINSFIVTGTGTIALTLQRAFDNFERRSSVVQASKSIKDPRLAVFGIEGVVESRNADVGGLFVLQPYSGGVPTNINMNINPANPYTEFTFPMYPLRDIFVNEIRFFGISNGIKFGKFLGSNAALTNGIEILIKTENELVTLPLIKTTEDFADKFAFGGGDNFQLYIQAGGDKFLASFTSAPFPLRRSGAFGVGNDDYIKIRIKDNTTVAASFQATIVGFTREA
jgi:hypothetical protein